MAASKQPAIEVPVGDRVVRVSNPDRVYFPASARPSSTWSTTTSASATASSTRCASGRACCIASRPESPATRCIRSGCPPARRRGSDTVRLHFPRYGLHADELCVTELAEVIWAVQMSTVEFHPWNSRRADTERPDEWRIDLDPMPDCAFATIRRVAGVAHEVLDELGAVGWPKTSGGRGMHIYVRIEPITVSPTCAGPRWRSPARSSAVHRPTSPRRGGARIATRPRSSSTTTRTLAITRWPRPTRCAACPMRRVSTPITWDEIDDVEPADFTIATVPDAIRRSRRSACGDRRGRVLDRSAAGMGRARRAIGRRRSRHARAPDE